MSKMTCCGVNSRTHLTLECELYLRFSCAVLQFARCRTQTAFPLTTFQAICFKTFTSDTHIRILSPQCPKLPPGSSQPGQSSGSSQSKSSGDGTSTPSNKIVSTSTSTEENKKQDEQKDKTTATQD